MVPLGVSLVCELSFTGFALILQHEQERFGQPQKRKRENTDQRYPESGVYPVWRLIGDFYQERSTSDDCANNQDGENGSTVTYIEDGVIQIAMCATWTHS